MILNALNKNSPPPSTTSFFDFHDGNSNFQFISPEPNHKKFLSNSAQLEACIICESPEEKVSLEGTFKVHNHLLVYYKGENPILVLDILYARLTLHDMDLKNPKTRLELIKNQNTFLLCFDKKTQAQEWINCLRSVCILTDFYTRYKSVRLSAKGTLTSTHLMRSSTSSELFSIKRFTKDRSTMQKMKPAILQEISTINITNHPNLIRLFEVYETESSICLVKEYIPGQTLRSLLQNPSFSTCHPDVKATQIIKPILSALAYLTSKEAVHGSLNPDNVIVDQNSKIKISNFGQVNLNDGLDNIKNEHRNWGFIAPEVFLGGKKLASIDVFSVGCILYEILFGIPLFKGLNPAQTLQLNKTYSYPTVLNRINKEMEGINTNINKQGLDLLARLLHPDPEKRISAEEAFNHAYLKAPILHINTLTVSACSMNLDNSEEKSQFLQTSQNKKSPEKSQLLTPTFGHQNKEHRSLHHIASLGGENYNSSRTFGNLSYYECIEITGKRQSYLKRETLGEEEESGDLFDIEDDVSNMIGNFLHTHNIQVALKNPGRLS